MKTDTPLVTIYSLAYNHAPFIRQCVEGILMQKTTFTFELIIHDDASTDGTADIIREYEALYPNIVKPIYQTENQYIKYNGNFPLPEAQGKYTAWCEGDDYWTDPLKLQKQVDFLETHPDYTLCGGMCWVLKEGMTEPAECDWLTKGMAKFPKGKTVTLQNFIYPYVLQWLTVCYRSDCWTEEKHAKITYHIDDIYYAILLEQGKGFVFPDYFGVYCMHQGGIYAGKSYEQQLRSSVEHLRELVLHFGNKSKSMRKIYFQNSINLHFLELKTSQHLFRDYIKILRFVFSGKLKDVVSFQIRYFFLRSITSFTRYCKNDSIIQKTVQNEY